MEVLPKLKGGKVLDIGCGTRPYRELIKYKEYKTLDSDRKLKPDFCSDVHEMKLPKESFDVVLATEILEHCYEPQKVVDNIWKVLKKNGECVASVPLIYPVHFGEEYKDYYRFTEDGMKHLFRKFGEVEVHPFGNLVSAVWRLISWRFKFFGRFNSLIWALTKDLKFLEFPNGYVVYARK